MIYIIADKSTLIKMDVMTGKYTVIFPFFTNISPGNLPSFINCRRKPLKKMIPPITISVFADPLKGTVPPF
jgi:hypothetical protein